MTDDAQTTLFAMTATRFAVTLKTTKVECLASRQDDQDLEEASGVGPEVAIAVLYLLSTGLTILLIG